MTLDEAIIIADEFLFPNGNQETRVPTYKQRCALRQCVRSAKEGVEHIAIIREVCNASEKAVREA